MSAHSPSPPNPAGFRRPRRRWIDFIVLSLVIPLLGGCPNESPKREPEKVLVVFAAASLREPFTELARGFENANPGVTVRLQFAGSQQLRMQLEHGAQADVFAAADPHHMEALVTAERVEEPERFARNALVVAVSRDAASDVTDFWELPKVNRIVLGHPQVPIGRYSARILGNAGTGFERRVRDQVVSEELSVRQVLHKVALGEADAGIVYRSDLRAVGEGVLRELEIPASLTVVAEYPVAVVKGTRHPDLAREWVSWVRSEEGARALERAGFLGAPGVVARP